MRHIRDLRVSFLIDSPEKFWIGEVSCMMASRGCRLTSLQTSAATIGPFEFTSDFGEGIATFMGPKGRIDIEKKDRKWMLSGNDRELEIHNLNHAFDDERVFCDAVSAYLLSNIAVNAANEANNDLRGSP